MTITQSFSKLSAIAAGLAVAFALIAGVFATATPARAAALTSAQVSSIISLLQSFGADAQTIANVQASLTGGTPTGGSTGGSTTGGSCPALTRDLQAGSTGADVMALQQYLNSNAATMVAASGAGSPGNETSYFGPATKAAVIKFQTAHSVSPAVGYVGPLTRAAIAANCGGSTGGTVPTGPGITVSAGAQPANAIAPESASRVPFTTFTITNNSGVVQTVSGVTVQRTGLGNDGAFAGVALVDASGIQLGIAKTLNSNHQATVGDNFTINPGETKTITVVGNMNSDLNSYSGQILSLQVVAVNSTAAVSGVLPINGASHTVNSNLIIGTATAIVSSFDPNSSSVNKSIGDTGVKFAGIRITAGSAEQVRLWSVRWNQSGSAASTDLANVMTYVDGTAYPTTISSDGKYYTATFSGGILIDKGLSKDIYVQGDVVGSSVSGRTVEFDIYKNTDVYMTGVTYGYGITVTPSGNTASSATDASQFLTSDGSTTGTPNTPFFSASKITVNPGSATSISKATEVAAQNIAVNVPNQPLGGFVTDFKGEAVSVQTLRFDVSTTSTLGPITNATIVDENGAVVAGPIDENQTTSGKLVFTDTVTFQTGRHVYKVLGKVATGAADGTTIQLTTDPSSDWSNITGQTSGNSISLSGQGSFSMNTMTVQTASLTVSLSAQPAAQNIVAGGAGILFANVQLDASQSGEDVRISAIPLRFSNVTGLSNCQLYDGSSALNTGSNVPSSLVLVGSGTNNFQLDNNLVVTKGTVKTLGLKCNTTSSATGTYTISLSGSDTITATGVTSGASVSVINSANTGATMTVGSSSVTLAVDSSSPSYNLAAGGTSGVTVGILNLHANNEAVTLQKLGLTLTSGSASELNSVSIWDGATQVGTVVFTGSNTVASSSSMSVTLPKDTDKQLTVKADLADIGSGQAGIDGALIKLDPNSVEGTGQASGNTVKSGASGNVAGVRVYNTFPTVALDSLGSTGIADGRLMHFKVTANSADKVGLGKFVFTLATTTLSVSNIQLFGYTDASYSNAISNQGTSGQIGNTVSGGNSTGFTIAPNLNPVEVPAGQTYYFELRGAIAGNTSGASVVTTLVGDSSASPATGTTDFASVSGNFVWSPNATTTAATSTGNDWTNGYGVAGLPSSGIFQSRSN